MANPPPPHYAAPSSGAPSAPAPAAKKDEDLPTAEQLVLDLCNPELREKALFLLSQSRDKFQQDIAPLLWHSFGTMAALLQGQSNRVCNALALFQCIASHPDTRMLFINAQIPVYLYPLLNTTYKTRPYEYLRLTSLGVIGALVKVATFIVQKVILDDTGLAYMCATSDRFFALANVLAQMLEALVGQPSPRLLKHIIRCYLRLTDNPSACDALRTCIPTMLTDGTFNDYLEVTQSGERDLTARLWLHQLLHNIAMASSGGGGPRAGLNRIMGM
ncbi:Cell differentiation protein RCD1-like protein [Dichanthelium oligosanthes]|uniref:Cell differentiation protein RCD1-like protein n=1 Tax=Dichanthelium oligosanthes TaxID=888268 RepID=A0A1E5VE85_9POAL|nr:Cell differentiation protein RCD1-like protein [Dichanthelium oligosanthes]